MSPARVTWVAAAFAVWAYQTPNRPVFRAGTITIPVRATVGGPDGRLVPDLTEDDFELRIDGQRREFSAFSNATVPVTVAILIDLSGSIRNAPPPPEHGQEREYYVSRYRQMIDLLVKDLAPEDRACIGLFAGQIGSVTSSRATSVRYSRRSINRSTCTARRRCGAVSTRRSMGSAAKPLEKSS